MSSIFVCTFVVNASRVSARRDPSAPRGSRLGTLPAWRAPEDLVDVKNHGPKRAEIAGLLWRWRKRQHRFGHIAPRGGAWQQAAGTCIGAGI